MVSHSVDTMCLLCDVPTSLLLHLGMQWLQQARCDFTTVTTLCVCMLYCSRHDKQREEMQGHTRRHSRFGQEVQQRNKDEAAGRERERERERDRSRRHERDKGSGKAAEEPDRARPKGGSAQSSLP